MIRRSERGSLFTILLGAVALSAALSLATYQLLSGIRIPRVRGVV